MNDGNPNPPKLLALRFFGGVICGIIGTIVVEMLPFSIFGTLSVRNVSGFAVAISSLVTLAIVVGIMVAMVRFVRTKWGSSRSFTLGAICGFCVVILLEGLCFVAVFSNPGSFH